MALIRWLLIDGVGMTKVALGIVDALLYVHSRKVIHRDIKPKNVLMFGTIGDAIIAKIADFGVSKLIEMAVMTHTRVGQDLYMAPEVKLNTKYGFAADIYSLAMTLFEMFNEQLVMKASDEVKHFIAEVQRGQRGSIPKSCKVPDHLRSVIERGWEDDPTKRPTLSDYYSVLNG